MMEEQADAGMEMYAAEEVEQEVEVVSEGDEAHAEPAEEQPHYGEEEAPADEEDHEMVEEEAQDEGEPDEGVVQEEAPLYVEEVAVDAEEVGDLEESAEHE